MGVKITNGVPSGLLNSIVAAISFLSALGLAALLSNSIGAAPIVPALAASLLLAGIQWRLGFGSPHADFASAAGFFVTWMTAFAVSLLGLSVVSLASPAGFVCEPVVPFGISIGLFGAFASSWMSTSLRVHRRTELQPLTHIALSWIAPFYGFFHSPWFVAQTLAIDCAGRSTSQGVVMGAAMLLAEVAGVWTAIWMFKPSQ